MTIKSMKTAGGLAGLAAKNSQFEEIGKRHGNEAIRIASEFSKKPEVDFEIENIDFKASMLNMLEGVVDLEIVGLRDGHRLTIGIQAKVEDAKIILSKWDLAKAVKAALKEVRGQSIKASGTPVRTVKVGEVKAFRKDDKIRFSAANLPGWNFSTTVDEMKKDREAIRGRLENSIRAYCVTDMYGNPDIEAGKFKIPPVQASQIVPLKKPLNVSSKETQQMIEASLAREAGEQARKPEGAGVSFSLVQARSLDAQQDFERSVEIVIEPLLMAHLQQKLGINNAKILGYDLSAMVNDPDGPEGTAIVTASYLNEIDDEVVHFEVKLHAGKVDLESIKRTEADIKAAEEERKRLEVVSREEAGKKFKEFVAREKSKAETQKNMGVAATVGYGSNHWKKGPADTIPIMKALLPKEYSKAGQKMVVDGFIYELEPTNYGSTTPEHSVFWMARLHPELSVNDVKDKVPTWNSSFQTMMASARR